MRSRGFIQEILLILKLFIFVSVSFIMFSCSTQQVLELKTDIDIGIPTVYNPKNPEPPPGIPSEIILDEELCLGCEQGKKDIFPSQMGMAAVDDEGNIYVVDRNECNVKVFDKNGRFIRTFGKKGSGSGKFLGPFYMRIVEGKGIMIYDYLNKRISYFTKEGLCLEEVSTEKYWRVFNPQPDSRGNIIAGFLNHKRRPRLGDVERTYVYSLLKMDPNFNPIMTIATFELIHRGYERPLIRPWFTYKVRKDDSVLWGIHSEKSGYELYITNYEGKNVKKIVKEYDPVKINEEDVKGKIGGRQRLIYPEYFPPFYRLTCDDEGKIYVQTYEKDKNSRVVWDVFDPEGRYITKFSLPIGELIFGLKKKHIYTLNEDGIPFVKRYRIKNWGKMKQGI